MRPFGIFELLRRKGKTEPNIVVFGISCRVLIGRILISVSSSHWLSTLVSIATSELQMEGSELRTRYRRISQKDQSSADKSEAIEEDAFNLELRLVAPTLGRVYEDLVTWFKVMEE